MTINDTLALAAKRLLPRTGRIPNHKRQHAWLDAEVLLSFVLKKDRTWLAAHSDTLVPSRTQTSYEALLARRRRHEPIAYIVGEKEFFGRPFRVSPSTLIPRPESELLIEDVKSLAAPYDGRVLIWDVGTGSGALAITAALEIPEAEVLGTDSSATALSVAKKNAQRLMADNVTFCKADLLGRNVEAWIRHHASTPLIVVANLPYLPTTDRKKMPPDVVRFEPSSALFAGKDGLNAIRTLLNDLASSALSPEAILLEYDPRQTKTLLREAKKRFPDANFSVRKDYAKRDRVLSIMLPPALHSAPTSL